MMAWRSETVITFHSEPRPASSPKASQATGQLEVRASAAEPTAPPTIVRASAGPPPMRRLTDGAVRLPTMPPMAPPVPRMAKVRAEVPSTSWPNSTKVAAVIMPMAFSRPRMTAIGHSSS